MKKNDTAKNELKTKKIRMVWQAGGEIDKVDILVNKKTLKFEINDLNYFMDSLVYDDCMSSLLNTSINTISRTPSNKSTKN